MVARGGRRGDGQGRLPPPGRRRRRRHRRRRLDARHRALLDRGRLVLRGPVVRRGVARPSPRAPVAGGMLTLVAAALIAVTPASASAQTPKIGVHAAFSGGRTSGFRIGEVLFVDVHGARPKRVCWLPAPLARPPCGRVLTGAPSQAGTTTVTVTFADGQAASTSFAVGAARTRVDGRHAVAAKISCAQVTLWGNWNARDGFHDKREVLKRDTPVALYNRIGPGVIFMWDYKRSLGGFAKERCGQPGL